MSTNKINWEEPFHWLVENNTDILVAELDNVETGEPCISISVLSSDHASANEIILTRSDIKKIYDILKQHVEL